MNWNKKRERYRSLLHPKYTTSLTVVIYIFSLYLVSFQKEIEVLKCNLSSISSTSDDGAQKLKQEYLQKLNFLETQVNLVALGH